MIGLILSIDFRDRSSARSIRQPFHPGSAGRLFAAVGPYLSTANDYFVRDDFGVVGLLERKPASYFPRWFVSSWMDDMFGETLDEVRPFTALSYQLTALGGVGAAACPPPPEHRLHAATSMLVFVMARASRACRFDRGVCWPGIRPVARAGRNRRVDHRTGSTACLRLSTSRRSWRTYGRKGESILAPCTLGVAGPLFVALFSKQTVPVTMAGTLVTYDTLVEAADATTVLVVGTPVCPVRSDDRSVPLARYAPVRTGYP